MSSTIVTVSLAAGRPNPNSIVRIRRALARYVQAQEPVIQKTFLKAMARMQKGTDMTALRAAIRAGDYSAAWAAVPWETVGAATLKASLPLKLRALFESGGEAALKMLRSHGIAYSFDYTSPHAVQYIRSEMQGVLTQFGTSQPAMIRRMMEESFSKHITVQETARRIRDQGIGLTSRMAGAVERREASLLAEGMLPAKAAARSKRYADRLRRLRAMTIARTETIRASTQGQLELIRQAQADGLIEHGKGEKEWVTAPVGCCDTCSDLDGVTVPADGSFMTPGGSLDGPPAHPACRCAINIWPKGKP